MDVSISFVAYIKQMFAAVMQCVLLTWVRSCK